MENRWLPMKRTALALNHLVGTRFRSDSLQIIAFGRYARTVTAGELAGLEGVYEQGTNLHHALALAGRHLRRHPNAQPVVLVVTDGEPTAHLEDYGDGDGTSVFFDYPPHPRTIAHTVRGIRRRRPARRPGDDLPARQRSRPCPVHRSGRQTGRGTRRGTRTRRPRRRGGRRLSEGAAAALTDPNLRVLVNHRLPSKLPSGDVPHRSPWSILIHRITWQTTSQSPSALVALIQRLTWRFHSRGRAGEDHVTDGADDHDRYTLRKDSTELWQNTSERLSCSSQLLLSVAVR